MSMEVWPKMTTTQITEVNAITGEIVERQFNAAEKIAHDLLKKEADSMAAAQAATDAVKAVAQSKLEALGLTADDLKALGL